MNSSYIINKQMENNKTTLFATIVDEFSGKEFTKEDLQQIQDRHQDARRQAVTRHLESPIKKIAYLIDKQTVLDATKFTEEDITEAHVMKHVRCITGSGSAVWQELYSNEEYCKKIMEKDNIELRIKRKQFEKEQAEGIKLKKSSFSEEERKLNNEIYQKEKKVKLMKHYGLR